MIGAIVIGTAIIGGIFIHELGQYAEEINPYNNNAEDEEGDISDTHDCGECMGASFGDCADCQWQ